MNDFRDELYSRYSTTFQQQICKLNDKSIHYVENKYKVQYLPLLKKYDKKIKILELGCGRGILLKFLADNGFKNVFGIDISEEQINIARQQNLKVKQDDVFGFLNSNNEKYDLIFAIDIIEHFSKDELIHLVKGIYNSLDDNGAFIFHTPNGLGFNSNRIIYGDLTHLTILTPNSATQILKLAGFDHIEYFETEPYAKNLNGAIRLILWKLIKFGLNIIRLVETLGSEKILTQNFIGVAKKSRA